MGKRVGNIYNKITDLDNIIKMSEVVMRNTKNKRKIEKFNQFFSCNVIDIKNILENKNYKISKYNIFLIKEPKYRIIMSQNIKDKIINHLVAKYFLTDILNNKLIDTNIATRKYKGTSYGIKKLKKYLNEIKYKNFYILKFDISKYFYNIDHDILKELIKTKIKDNDALNIIYNIIDSINNEIRKLKYKETSKLKNKSLINEINNIPEYIYNKGLPIGNMTSQILAIFYLDELDHYIKNNLKIKYYIRYVDDGILIHEDKLYLRYCLNKIENILNKYKLKLNSKTKIYSIKEGFEFLGFRYYIKNNKLVMKVNNLSMT